MEASALLLLLVGDETASWTIHILCTDHTCTCMQCCFDWVCKERQAEQRKSIKVAKKKHIAAEPAVGNLIFLHGGVKTESECYCPDVRHIGYRGDTERDENKTENREDDTFGASEGVVKRNRQGGMIGLSGQGKAENLI